MGNKPSVLISGAARIDLFESFANGVALVEFNRQIRSQRGRSMGHMAPGAFRQNQAKSGDSAATVGVARAIQPQQRKRKATFHGVRRFSVRNSKNSKVRRAAPEQATNIVAGNGMLEIRRGGQRLDRFIGKLLREEMAEAIAKSFARKIALRALKFHANKFETVGLGAAESLDGKRQALVGMIGDSQNAARQIVILRPQVQERLLRGAAHFPGKSREGSDAPAILANFDSAIRGEFLETSLQFSEQVHAGKYKGNNF